MIRLIDIETTGIDPATDAIIEIASIDLVRGGGITNAMDTLVPPGASAIHHCDSPHRTTNTGMVVCASTFTVSLPSTMAEIPRRPCEAMAIRSHPLDVAVSMIAL